MERFLTMSKKIPTRYISASKERLNTQSRYIMGLASRGPSPLCKKELIGNLRSIPPVKRLSELCMLGSRDNLISLENGIYQIKMGV